MVERLKYVWNYVLVIYRCRMYKSVQKNVAFGRSFQEIVFYKQTIAFALINIVGNICF